MKQNKSSRSTVLLFLLGAALIVAALIMLVPDLLNYKQSNDTYEALKENYISEKAENTEVAEETEGEGFLDNQRKNQAVYASLLWNDRSCSGREYRILFQKHRVHRCGDGWKCVPNPHP